MWTGKQDERQLEVFDLIRVVSPVFAVVFTALIKVTVVVSGLSRGDISLFSQSRRAGSVPGPVLVCKQALILLQCTTAHTEPV